MSPTGYNDKLFFFVKNTSQRYEMPSGQKGRRGGGKRSVVCLTRSDSRKSFDSDSRTGEVFTVRDKRLG